MERAAYRGIYMTEEGKQTNKPEVVIDDGRIESIQEFQSPEQLYADLISRVKKYHPSDDISLIEKAYQVAARAHEGQVRKSGEPYIIHPLYVAIILSYKYPCMPLSPFTRITAYWNYYICFYPDSQLFPRQPSLHHLRLIPSAS